MCVCCQIYSIAKNQSMLEIIHNIQLAINLGMASNILKAHRDKSGDIIMTALPSQAQRSCSVLQDEKHECNGNSFNTVKCSRCLHESLSTRYLKGMQTNIALGIDISSGIEQHSRALCVTSLGSPHQRSQPVLWFVNSSKYTVEATIDIRHKIKIMGMNSWHKQPTRISPKTYMALGIHVGASIDQHARAVRVKIGGGIHQRRFPVLGNECKIELEMRQQKTNMRLHGMNASRCKSTCTRV